MTRTWRRRLCCISAIVLLCSCMSATAEDLGLDSRLTSWLAPEGTLQFAVGAQLDSWLPFSEERIAMINALLARTTFEVELNQEHENARTSLRLSVADEPLFSLTEWQQAGSFRLETSLLPAQILQSAASSPIALLGGTEDEGEPAFDMLTAISEAEGQYRALIDACEPYAEKKRANYKIKNIGTSTWSQIARLTTEQSEEMLPLLRGVLQSGMDSAYREELSEVHFGRGFIVGLYKQSEEGKDLALYMKGDLKYPDGSIHKLSYQWAFLNDGTERKDSYRYELSGGKPSSSRMADGLMTQKTFSDNISISGTAETTRKANKITTSDLVKMELSGEQRDGLRTLTGSFSTQTKITDGNATVTTVTTLTPKLEVNIFGDSQLVGSVGIERQNNKTVPFACTLTFADNGQSASALNPISMYAVKEDSASSMPAQSSLSYSMEEDESSPAVDIGYLVGGAPIGLKNFPAAAPETVISMDGLSASALDSLLLQLSQNLAGRLLIAYMKLPEEETLLLRDGMTADDYAAFSALLSGL